MNPNVMLGGTFNLRYGRKPVVVKKELHRLTVKHDLDWLCVQEAADYFDVLHEIPSYEYFSTRVYKGGSDAGILVHKRRTPSKARYDSYGDGWVTVRGGRHSPLTFPRVTIDGWLRVGSVHMPSSTTWGPHGLELPPERKDDYLPLARAVKRFMLRGNNTRVALGDWNEKPETMGPWSPGWIAARSGSTIACPDQVAGFGRIDYAMVKNGDITHIWKDLKSAEGSDHEPVVCRLERDV